MARWVAGEVATYTCSQPKVEQPTPEIRVERNEFRNNLGRRAVFLNNVTATEAELVGNRFTGLVTPLMGDGSVRP